MGESLKVATKKITKTGTANSSRSVVDRLDIFAIGVESISAKLDRSNYAAAYSGSNKKIARRIESVYQVADYSEEHFDVTGMLFLRIKANGFEDPILSIDIAITGHFHPKSTLSREDVEQFAGAEARLIFWPYFRELVSDITSRMHVRVITLPVGVS